MEWRVIFQNIILNFWIGILMIQIQNHCQLQKVIFVFSYSRFWHFHSLLCITIGFSVESGCKTFCAVHYQNMDKNIIILKILSLN